MRWLAVVFMAGQLCFSMAHAQDDDCRFQEGAKMVEVSTEARELYEQALLYDIDVKPEQWPAKETWQGIQSYQKAIELYERSAKLGNPKAMNRLANFLLSGREVKQDQKRAYDLYRQAIALGYGPAYEGMANVFIGGIPGIIKPDERRGVACLYRAAELGSPYAQYLYGSLLIGELAYAIDDPGFTLPASFSPQEGEKWLVKAGENGYYKAYYILAEYFYNNGFEKNTPDLRKSEHYARIGASKGNKQCLLILEMGYSPGQGKFGSDQKREECYGNLFASKEFKRGHPIQNIDELCPRTPKTQ